MAQEILRSFNEECRKGKHPLISIYSEGGDQESAEVRWCPTCGSVVVDEDFDGRTNPGAIVAMRSPRILENQHDNPLIIGKALTENEGLGIALVLEAGEKKDIPVTGSESQLEFRANDQATKQTVDLLQQAGLLTLSPSSDSLSLTPEGAEIHSKLIRQLDEIKNRHDRK